MKRNPLSIISIRRAILILLVCFISMSIMAQKVKLDTLDIDQLNLYKHKAVTLRNAGMILTFGGVFILATAYYTWAIWMQTDPFEDSDIFLALIPIQLGILVGIPSTIAGIPLWAIGGSRKAKAEIALKMVDIKTDNSMAVGLGVTIRF